VHFQNGGSIEDIFADYTKNHVVKNAPEQLRKIKELKSKEYAARFHLIEQNNTTVGLLRALAPHHFTALATTATKKNAGALLEYFGLTHLFQYAVYGDDVTHKKPDPECHQKIADHFKVSPDECIIFEDSSKGFAAAEAFGGHICKVVQ
jgi:HAD superfamily hydrolase (TIGR01509 family)